MIVDVRNVKRNGGSLLSLKADVIRVRVECITGISASNYG